LSNKQSLKDRVALWKHFMLLNPPPPPNPVPFEEWDDYALSKLGATQGKRGAVP